MKRLYYKVNGQETDCIKQAIYRKYMNFDIDVDLSFVVKANLKIAQISLKDVEKHKMKILHQ